MSEDASPRPAEQSPRLFAVRLWKEELAGGSEYRGTVRDVVTDAFRGFCHWADLVAFMVAPIEQDENARGRRDEGGSDVHRCEGGGSHPGSSFPRAPSRASVASW